MTVQQQAPPEAWATMTIERQLANVGTDVAIAIRARDASDRQALREALDRAIGRLEATAADSRWPESHRREVAMIRKVVADYFDGPNALGTTDGFLDRWFSFFAGIANQSR